MTDSRSTGKVLINERISDKLKSELQSLDALIDGDVLTSLMHRLMYATDASAYRELPLAICRPQHEKDIIELVGFAKSNKITLIPRTLSKCYFTVKVKKTDQPTLTLS